MRGKAAQMIEVQLMNSALAVQPCMVALVTPGDTKVLCGKHDPQDGCHAAVANLQAPEGDPKATETKTDLGLRVEVVLAAVAAGDLRPIRPLHLVGCDWDGSRSDIAVKPLRLAPRRRSCHLIVVIDLRQAQALPPDQL